MSSHVINTTNKNYIDGWNEVAPFAVQEDLTCRQDVEQGGDIECEIENDASTTEPLLPHVPGTWTEPSF